MRKERLAMGKCFREESPLFSGDNSRSAGIPLIQFAQANREEPSMPHAIDFTELKQRVSIERAAEMLGIKTPKSGGQRRGTCPVCKAGGERAFVLTPTKGLYYCFGTCSKGGDAI